MISEWEHADLHTIGQDLAPAAYQKRQGEMSITSLR